MFCHLSPYEDRAVGGGNVTQKLTLTCCPTPIGLGDTMQKGYIGIFNGGVCALTSGSNVVDALIEIAKSIMIEIAVVLFLFVFIFVLSFFS